MDQPAHADFLVKQIQRTSNPYRQFSSNQIFQTWFGTAF